MKEIITNAVHELFKNYEETPRLKDFEEEITINLTERVNDLVKKGLSENEAIARALTELGDVTVIAEEIGKQKRQEAIGDYYALNFPISKMHALGYSVATAISLVGVLLTLILGYKTLSIGQALIIFLALVIPAIGIFIFFGLTQETNVTYPFTKRRSLLYAVGCWLLLTGVFLGCIIIFWETAFLDIKLNTLDWLKTDYINEKLLFAIISFIVLLIPGITLLCYLGLTEEQHTKPWHLEKYRGRYGEKFGLLSGFIWIMATAIFLLLGFTVGWHISWIIFIFGAGFEILAVLLIDERSNKK